jgi:hypothetical protein
MVTKDKTRKAVAYSILNDPRVPSDIDVLLEEADPDGQNAAKTIPLLNITFDSDSKFNQRNTELVGYKLDDNGNRVAEIYERRWEGELFVESWTADASNVDADELGTTIQSVLYGFDTKSSNDTLIDPDGNPVDDIWRFSVRGGRRIDDLSNTPTVRRWRNRVEVYGAEQYKTPAQTPLEGVNQPDVLENR